MFGLFGYSRGDKEMNDIITKELMELADNNIKIDPLCYVECRRQHHIKRYCTEICREHEEIVRKIKTGVIKV